MVVANAGGPPQARALETDDEGMLAAVNANMLTSIRLVDAAVPHLRVAGWGRICLLTSNAVKHRVTELGHAGRLGDPDEFGQVVTFLCSRPAGFISGAALQVDGAGTLGLL